MKIEKKTIASGINLIAQTFESYKKHLTENGGIQTQTENWYDILQVIEDDYPEANEDFSTAVKLAITGNQYAPTIKEILDKMKMIKEQRKIDIERKKYINFLNLIQDYPFYRINTGVELSEAFKTYESKKVKDDDLKKAIKNYKMILEIKNEIPTKPINIFLKDISEYIRGK